MVRDDRRGWAFTRALLAAVAPEVHICGEEAAISVVQRILDPIGEHVEIRKYERKSPLTVSTHGLRNISEAEDGDCFVCFGKTTIMSLMRKIARNCKREVAVIYGDMPPTCKLAQAAKFNDPDNPCKILVATDAIGMGINLNIRRVIFASMARIALGEKELPNYFARQIAGRAGRFGLKHQEGYTLALADSRLNEKNHAILKRLMSEPIKSIEKAGVAPTFSELEMFSFLLPSCSFVNLLDILVSVCSTSNDYFICLPEEMRTLAGVIEDVHMELKDKWIFCHVPIKGKEPVLAKVFKKLSQKYSDNEVATYEFLHDLIEDLVQPAIGLQGLVNLGNAHDCVGMYLWLSYRYPVHFPDVQRMRILEKKVEALFQSSLEDITSLNTNNKWNK